MRYSISEEDMMSRLSWLPLPSDKDVIHEDASYKVLFGQADGARSVMVRMQRYPSGGHTDTHFHGSEEQLFYIIQGRGRFKVDEEEYIVGPGSIVFVPINTKHYYENSGESDLIFLFIRSFLAVYGLGSHNMVGGPDEIEPTASLGNRLSSTER
jgi:quercetin dioxygenase-like cupin family protein